MISQLTGTISHTDLRSIILDVHGVGYKITIGADTLIQIKKIQAEPVRFWTHLAVRENSLDLYGFLDEEGLRFFELLISISGIGPKTAMGILSGATVETLRSAISSGEPGHLVKMAGVSKKTAEKLVLELKDKVGLMAGDANERSAALAGESDVIEALTALGYSQKEARDAVAKIPKDISKTSEKVKQALKMLGTN